MQPVRHSLAMREIKTARSDSVSVRVYNYSKCTLLLARAEATAPNDRSACERRKEIHLRAAACMSFEPSRQGPNWHTARASFFLSPRTHTYQFGIIKAGLGEQLYLKLYAQGAQPAA